MLVLFCQYCLLRCIITLGCQPSFICTWTNAICFYNFIKLIYQINYIILTIYIKGFMLKICRGFNRSLSLRSSVTLIFVRFLWSVFKMKNLLNIAIIDAITLFLSYWPVQMRDLSPCTFIRQCRHQMHLYKVFALLYEGVQLLKIYYRDPTVKCICRSTFSSLTWQGLCAKFFTWGLVHSIVFEGWFINHKFIIYLSIINL